MSGIDLGWELEASSQLIHAVGELQGGFTPEDGADIGGNKADACTWKLIVRNFHSQLLDETEPSAAPEEQFKCAFWDHQLAVNRVSVLRIGAAAA
jgi:hypothetical protein